MNQFYSRLYQDITGATDLAPDADDTVMLRDILIDEIAAADAEAEVSPAPRGPRVLRGPEDDIPF